MAVSQNEALLVAVFKQLAVTKLDYRILGKDLGLSREAARNRWVRFQAKIMQSANSNNALPYEDTSTPQTPPQTPSPVKKKVGAAKARALSAKKRKRVMSEDSDQMNLNLKKDMGQDRDLEAGQYIEAEEMLEMEASRYDLAARGELW
ncbi:hypothetical protein ONS95_009033 [Cadophora gregata]|uniref:uncharacterized protein n=1 Tax=Cadophora gregata TaxID=51156 RepID=UPI0026DCB61B|nr:uncharacterized protein ONS95_009033 [Cadophora gregata]KAK0124047.1 hypothetical protein ONS95_009033 [Cadophora gregata]